MNESLFPVKENMGSGTGMGTLTPTWKLMRMARKGCTTPTYLSSLDLVDVLAGNSTVVGEDGGSISPSVLVDEVNGLNGQNVNAP